MAMQQPFITLETIIKKTDRKLLTNEVGADLVMMDLEKGIYISLNKVGRIIWESLDAPVKVKDLISKLMIRFKVLEEECRNDTLEYLNDMLKQQVIDIQ